MKHASAPAFELVLQLAETLPSNAAMPILKPEPEMFPNDLFQTPATGNPWVVAHVMSRREKLLARELRFRRILRTKGKLRLVVTISLLNKSVAVELDRDVLIPSRNLVAGAGEGSRHAEECSKSKAVAA